ncbi:MAG: hypothetical protein ACI8ZM_000422 [Crocinitomix sp.]|jgi:hypothetical protein
MTKEVEDIIRNKAYYELTGDERASVGEYAQNEEEYNNMQWFLTGTTAAFGGAKIEASPGLKKGVMAHLTEEKKKKGFWLNSVGVFMLPTNKKFYQKPAFQLGIAAVLVVGLLFVMNPDVKDIGLAYIDDANESPVELNENNRSDQTIIEDQKLEDLADKALSNEQEIEQELAPAEREEAELGEVMNEITIDLAPVPVPVPEVVMGEAEGFDLAIGATTFAAPLMNEVNEVELMDAEEVVSFDYYADDAVVVETMKSDLDKDFVKIEEKTTESLDTKEKGRDKSKSTALRSIGQKKGTAKQNKLSNSEPGNAGATEDGDVITNVPTGSNTRGYAESGEWIKPKALHINKTKELNDLFFIEK